MLSHTTASFDLSNETSTVSKVTNNKFTRFAIKCKECIGPYVMAKRGRTNTFIKWRGLQDDEWDIRSVNSTMEHGDNDIAREFYTLEYSSWKNISEKKLLNAVNPPVFIMSSLVVLAFCLTVIIAKDSLQRIMPDVLVFVSKNFGWFYVVLNAILVVTLIYLLFCHGDVKLGDDEPDYPMFTWISMLFSAGVGVALVFYGPSQPLEYYNNPPIADTTSRVAYEQAVPLALLVQGYFCWPCYSFLGLAVAYIHNVVGLPISIRSLAAPILGKFTHRWPGHLIDIIAVVGTVVGIAATLGIGATQLTSGINYCVPSIPNDIRSELVILLVVGFLAGISVLCGLSKGMALLANINIAIGFIWMIVISMLNPDPTKFGGVWFPITHIEAIVQNIGGYINIVTERAFRTASDNVEEQKWMGSWCYFFIGWQLTWCPFVASFLAAISKGRTIRSFVLVTNIAPAIVNLVWFSIMGRVAIIVNESYNEQSETLLQDEPRALLLYKILGHMHKVGSMSKATMVFLIVTLIILLIVFIVTSADSATYVIVLLNAGGDPKRAKTWLKLHGLILVITTCGMLLWLGGPDLFDVLGAVLIVMGLPLGILMLFSVASLLKVIHIAEKDGQQLRRDFADTNHIDHSESLNINRILTDKGMTEQFAGNTRGSDNDRMVTLSDVDFDVNDGQDAGVYDTTTSLDSSLTIPATSPV